MYKVMLNLHSLNPTKFKWISKVKSILDSCGLSFIWENQISMDRKVLKNMILRQLNDQFIQTWFSQMNNSSRGKFYAEYKNQFCLETYLLKLNLCDRVYISKFRCSNIKFPVETGRWNGTLKTQRLCHLCGNGVGDEFHYLFVCQKEEIMNIRGKYIPKYYTVNPTEYKLQGLLLFCHVELYKNLAKFLKILCRYL